MLLGSVATLAAKASSVARLLLSKIAAESSACVSMPFGMLNIVEEGVLLHFSIQDQINGKLNVRNYESIRLKLQIQFFQGIAFSQTVRLHFSWDSRDFCTLVKLI